MAYPLLHGKMEFDKGNRFGRSKTREKVELKLFFMVCISGGSHD